MNILELMHDHVRTIYRAVTGSDLPEGKATEGAPPPIETLATRFADLERMARSIPSLADRLPTFSFAPPLDVVTTERELIIELGVPGVDKRDVRVEVRGQLLLVSGTLSGEGKLEGAYYHAEIPRGPFSRVIALPHAITGDPRIEVARGLIRIRLSKLTRNAPAKA